MTLQEAKKVAKDIAGLDAVFPHRNVWIFYDDENGDLIITKDDAPVKKTGVFRNDPKRNELVNVLSGEVVLFEDVYGKVFFEDKPSLLIDNITSDTADLTEKIDVLLALTEDLLKKQNMPLAALFMVDDLAEDYDDLAYRRLVVFYNYLSSCNTNISLEEFTYLHHELYTME